MYCRLLISCHDIRDAHRSVLDVTVYQHLAGASYSCFPRTASSVVASEADDECYVTQSQIYL